MRGLFVSRHRAPKIREHLWLAVTAALWSRLSARILGWCFISVSMGEAVIGWPRINPSKLFRRGAAAWPSLRPSISSEGERA
jgi:hypothetical protein